MRNIFPSESYLEHNVRARQVVPVSLRRLTSESESPSRAARSEVNILSSLTERTGRFGI